MPVLSTGATEFISMLSDEVLSRTEYAVIKAKNIGRKRAQTSKAKVIDIKTEEAIPEISQ